MLTFGKCAPVCMTLCVRVVLKVPTFQTHHHSFADKKFNNDNYYYNSNHNNNNNNSLSKSFHSLITIIYFVNIQIVQMKILYYSL